MRILMGFLSPIFGFFGFSAGVSIGVFLGYYLFIFFQPTDVKVPPFLSSVQDLILNFFMHGFMFSYSFLYFLFIEDFGAWFLLRNE